MAEDFNINIRNGMGGGGKTTAHKKISAKGSIERAKETMRITGSVKKTLGGVNKALSIASGSGSAGFLSSAVSKGNVVLGLAISTAEKLASFGVNMYEAETGNVMASHNARNTIRTISSLGMNYVGGYIANELITKKMISRQNYGMDYGRELYSINVEGTKNKRI
jgi:hypothetical protein